eukprot:2980231-Prymnesium_polylepis.1
MAGSAARTNAERRTAPPAKGCAPNPARAGERQLRWRAHTHMPRKRPQHAPIAAKDALRARPHPAASAPPPRCCECNRGGIPCAGQPPAAPQQH